MELRYATRDLERTCADARRMQKSLGAERAKKLQLRLDDLRAAEKMADLLQMTGKWEELTADRTGQWSARLTGNWRLIVQPEERDEAIVLVVEIVDYH